MLFAEGARYLGGQVVGVESETVHRLGLTQRPVSGDSPHVNVLPRLALSVVAAAFVAAGCGASNGTGSTQPRPASTVSRSNTAAPQHASEASRKIRMIGAADAICQRLNADFSVSKPVNQSIAEIVSVAPARAALERQAVAKLTELEPPPSIAAAWWKILGYRRVLATELAELGQQAKRKDVAAIQALGASKERVHHELLVAGAATGFKACSRVG